MEPGSALEAGAARPWAGAEGPSARRLVVQLPLGETATASVMLVRDPDSGRVFRLKTWHRPAPPEFLERFGRLQAQLEAWAEPTVPPLVAAWVDVAGRPAVLGAFRQGTPLMDRVRAGTLAADDAVTLVTRLEAVVQAAHERDLAHGSIVAGNVLCDGSQVAALLDFGLGAVIGSTASPNLGAAADREGLETLKRILEQMAERLTGARPPDA